MKIITVQIKSCEVCFNHYESVNWVHYCEVVAKDIDDVTQIPDWCPLPDAPLSSKSSGQDNHCEVCGKAATRWITHNLCDSCEPRR